MDTFIIGELRPWPLHSFTTLPELNLQQGLYKLSCSMDPHRTRKHIICVETPEDHQTYILTLLQIRRINWLECRPQYRAEANIRSAPAAVVVSGNESSWVGR